MRTVRRLRAPGTQDQTARLSARIAADRKTTRGGGELMPKIRGFAKRDLLNKALQCHFKRHFLMIGAGISCSCGWKNDMGEGNFIEHLSLVTASLINSGFYIYARHPKPK